MANILKKFLSNEKLKADQVYYDSVTSLLDAVYPIGRGFIDFTNTDYSNYLGFTWERELVGMVGVGLDTSQTEFNTIGKTGGEKEHTLTVQEMSKHNHTVSYLKQEAGNDYQFAGGVGNWQTTGEENGNINSTGGDQAHNNLQPYKVVAYWKRIA